MAYAEHLLRKPPMRESKPPIERPLCARNTFLRQQKRKLQMLGVALVPPSVVPNAQFRLRRLKRPISRRSVHIHPSQNLRRSIRPRAMAQGRANGRKLRIWIYRAPIKRRPARSA